MYVNENKKRYDRKENTTYTKSSEMFTHFRAFHSWKNAAKRVFNVFAKA